MGFNKKNTITEEINTNAPFFKKQGVEDRFFTKPEIAAKGEVQNNNALVQRKCDKCEQEEQEDKLLKKETGSIQRKEVVTGNDPLASSDESLTKNTTLTSPAPASGIIVNDTEIPGPGQMCKTDFLTLLKTEICRTANDALANTIFASGNCPYLQPDFDKYQNYSTGQIDALIKQYAPSAAFALDAQGMIQCMKVKVYADTLEWMQKENGLAGTNEMIDSFTGGFSSAVGNAISGIAGLFFKTNGEGSTPSQSPLSVMNSLGKGNPIESSTRSKMENAFGSSFSNVEIHTDPHAAQLSANMNARAFTVGNHIAFAAGEHQPGDLVGDALLAHELAHTIQQNNGVQNKTADQHSAENGLLENEADSSAIEAVTTIWSKRGMNKADIKPKAKKGLSISRCPRKSTAPPKKAIDAMDMKELTEIINNPDKYSLGELGSAKARLMMLEHRESIAKTGKGTIQGNQCSAPASPGVKKQDCTTYVLEILEFAFKAKGLGAIWDDVFNDAKTNSNGPKYGTKKGFKGTELITSLVSKAGWKALFWSPDPTNPNDPSPEQRPEHSDAFNKVNKTGKYYGIPVEKSDSVVNFRRSSSSAATDTTKLNKLKQVPLAIIGARGGLHMTVLMNGVVYEVHYTREENDPNVIETTPLENWEWRSGVLAMPESDYQAAFK